MRLADRFMPYRPLAGLFALLLASMAPATALALGSNGVPCSLNGSLVCSWDDFRIDNPEVDPTFKPQGTATFELLDADTLKITLAYTGFNDDFDENALTGLTEQAMAQTGLLWDFQSPVSASSVSVSLGSSSIVGTNSGSFTTSEDIGLHWAYKEGIDADGDGHDLGAYGLGAIGDINFGADTFGATDLISDPGGPTNQPNGTDWGLVPDGFPWPCSDGFCAQYPDGFKTQGPYVQNSLMFQIDYDGPLSLAEIRNVQPIFGSDGAPPIPEPTGVALFGLGFAVVGIAARRRLGR